jgi:hypothetical protein
LLPPGRTRLRRQRRVAGPPDVIGELLGAHQVQDGHEPGPDRPAAGEPQCLGTKGGQVAVGTPKRDQERDARAQIQQQLQQPDEGLTLIRGVCLGRADGGRIREHISAARATHRASRGGERDSDVLNLLEELGAPEEIAAAALEAGDRPVAPPGQGRPVLEIVALLLLSVGSLVVPILGWLAGVVLLWLSPLWTRKDKLIGTFLPPGGVGVLLLIGLYGGLGTGACDTLTVNGQVVQDTCAHGARYIWQITLAVVLLLVFLVLPIVTVAYLGRRLRRASSEPLRRVPHATLPGT